MELHPDNWLGLMLNYFPSVIRTGYALEILR